jgi:hypothetical protein
VLFGAQQQEQAREAADAGQTGCRTAFGGRCCGCHRPHPLGHRTKRQNDGRRRIARSLERHLSAYSTRRTGGHVGRMFGPRQRNARSVDRGSSRASESGVAPTRGRSFRVALSASVPSVISCVVQATGGLLGEALHRRCLSRLAPARF